MANNYTSYKTSYINASRFIRELSSDDTYKPIHYVFLGNSNEYANNDTVIPDISESVKTDKDIWDTMFTAKRVYSGDVELVIPKRVWSSGYIYQQYDDSVDIETLLDYNVTSNSYPMYVMTSVGNVYKCLSNNVSSQSTVEPTGNFSTSNGRILTSDSYVWKYMYNVRNTNKFLTEDWIPIPQEINTIEYSSSPTNAVDGTISSIVVTNGGIGYIDSNVAVSPYTTGTNTIVVVDTTYINENMYVDGVGIIPGTYVSSIDRINREMTLSLPVISNSNSSISVSTRVVISGDGTSEPIITYSISNTSINSIQVINSGKGYTRANVQVYGTGSNAAARAIISPKYGHGYNPAKELSAKHVVVISKFGVVDSTENGVISIDTSFRQYGLLSGPYKYSESIPVNNLTANNLISQTLDITLLPGIDFTLDEYVYQGQTQDTSTFSGIVHAQESDINKVRLINTKGTPLLGGLLKGATSSRVVSSFEPPEFQPYSGDIMYVKNISPIRRFEGQAEIIKLIIKF